MRLTIASILFASHACWFISVPMAQAQDIAITIDATTSSDRRQDYANALLEEVLLRTTESHGPYTIKAGMHAERKRHLELLKYGIAANVTARPTNHEWESALIPILIPIDMGLQSWRIGLINKKNQATFQAINTIDELKKMRLGAGNTWVSEDLLKRNGFTVITGNNYEGLFGMLTLNRFDYFPRGVNEIFSEFDHFSASNPTLMIEESILLHDFIPSFFFVSPQAPHLAERIQSGLEAMLKNGALRQFMLQFHKELLARANLCRRKVFALSNPDLPASLVNRKDIWFDPLDPKNGLCPRKASPPHANRH